MTDDKLVNRLADFWAQEIPMTRALGVAVDAWDGKTLVLGAALAANKNDKGTAFGGSLYSLAVLAGWGLVMLSLWRDGYDCDVVIQHASVDYLSPVRTRLVATCCVDEPAVWQAFRRQLDQRGKARLLLQPTVAGDNNPALRMSANFVASVRA